MCKASDKPSAEKSAEKPKKKVPGVPFTPMTARQAQEASAKARSLRKQMRARLVQALVDEGLEGMFIKAVKGNDTDRMKIIESAMKLTGLDFGSSEEAVQKVDLKADATLNGKVDSKLEVVFKDIKTGEG